MGGRRKRARLRAFAIIASACSACSARPSASPSAPAPVSDAAPRSPLDYVPSAGLRWLAFAQPRLIYRDSALRPWLEQVISRERLDAFTALTAVDLRELPAAVVASYDLGTLHVAALAAPDGGRARARFEERLSSGAIVKHPRPMLYRITGTRAGEPRALVSVNDRLLAFASGELSLARVAEAYAEQRLKSPTALRGAALSTLPPPPESALAAFYFPGPFERDWAQAAHGLLGPALAVGVTVEKASDAALRVTVVVAGDWPAEHPEAELEAAWGDLANSSTGQLFGLDLAKNMKIVEHLHQLTWSGELAVEPLVRGLRAATIANVPEMFGDHSQTPSEQSAQPDSKPR